MATADQATPGRDTGRDNATPPEAWPAGAPEVAGSVPGAATAHSDEMAGLREELERRRKGAEAAVGAGGEPRRD